MKRALTQTLRTLIVEKNRTPEVFTNDIRGCKGRVLELHEQDYKGAKIQSGTLTLGKDEDIRALEDLKNTRKAARGNATE